MLCFNEVNSEYLLLIIVVHSLPQQDVFIHQSVVLWAPLVEISLETGKLVYKTLKCDIIILQTFPFEL